MNTKKYITLDQALEVLDRQSCYWAAEYMELIPAADVREVRRGKWVFDNPLTADFMCDNCLERQIICTPFCPNCGADMREES